MMRINVIAFSATVGLFWAVSLLLVGLANLAWPSYGMAFLELAASIYPGYDAGASVGQVITGTLYGLVDGAIAGLVFAWLYNLLSGLLPAKAG